VNATNTFLGVQFVTLSSDLLYFFLFPDEQSVFDEQVVILLSETLLQSLVLFAERGDL
jgi:hypothetical protein